MGQVYVKAHRRGKSFVLAYKRAVKSGNTSSARFLGQHILRKHIRTVHHMDAVFSRSATNSRLLYNMGRRAKGLKVSIYS